MAALVVASTAADDLDLTPPLRFSAVVVDRVNRQGAKLDLWITQWSPVEDARALEAAFEQGGTGAVVRVLARMPGRGRVLVSGQPGADLQFARQFPIKGGALVQAIARRSMSFNDPDGTMDFPLTVVALTVDSDGKGTGTIAPFAIIADWDPGTELVTPQNFDMNLLSLSNVVLQRDRKKKK